MLELTEFELDLLRIMLSDFKTEALKRKFIIKLFDEDCADEFDSIDEFISVFDEIMRKVDEI